MYLRGEGTERDYGLARQWFERGAGQESPGCHTGLGMIYRHGLGVEVDEKKALHYFSEASSMGDGVGKVKLAVELLQAVPVDWPQVISLLDTARLKGFVLITI